MSLAILSSIVEPQENTFKNVLLASLRAKLFFAVGENALKSNGLIADINIRRYFGNGEDNYENILMDIHDRAWSIKEYEHMTFENKENVYYLLAGTDNAPTQLCYDFSLQYLRLCPKHFISIYDIIFSLSDIEAIKETTGYVDDWLQRISTKKT